MEATNMDCIISSVDKKKVKVGRSGKDIFYDEEVKLPGFRFHPTDEELVGFYLRRKVEKKPISVELIKQIDIYKYDPWDLPKISSFGEKEWYFFCLRGRKYRNSIRPNRVVTGSGFWKATGIDKPIYSADQPPPICIGLKKSLVYYRGSAGKGSKTDWMMHEFRLPPNGKHFQNAKNVDNNSQEAEVWTLCRIFKRTPSSKKHAEAWKLDATLMKPKETHSKTCSPQSNGSHENSEHCMNFCESAPQQKHGSCKPNTFMDQVDARNYLLLGGIPPWSSSTISATVREETDPFAATTYPAARFWNHPNAEVDVFSNGNWDELRPMVQLALEPYPGHGGGAFNCT